MIDVELEVAGATAERSGEFRGDPPAELLDASRARRPRWRARPDPGAGRVRVRRAPSGERSARPRPADGRRRGGGGRGRHQAVTTRHRPRRPVVGGAWRRPPRGHRRRWSRRGRTRSRSPGWRSWPPLPRVQWRWTSTVVSGRTAAGRDGSSGPGSGTDQPSSAACGSQSNVSAGPASSSPAHGAWRDESEQGVESGRHVIGRRGLGHDQRRSALQEDPARRGQLGVRARRPG